MWYKQVLAQFGGGVNFSKEEKEILEKLKESENFIPSPDKDDKSFFKRMKDMFH